MHPPGGSLGCVDALTGLWRSDPIGLVAVTLPGALMIALQKSAAIRGAEQLMTTQSKRGITLLQKSF